MKNLPKQNNTVQAAGEENRRPVVPLRPIAPDLLRWYHACRRILPFREEPSPYRIWVSEIMLQQTRVDTVLPYYERFMQALPTVQALAECDEQLLQKLWQGLGYYSRARNLQKAAQVVMQQYGGNLPADYDALLALPGIGAYTAGAIASIAFGLPKAAVDGNVLRVFARLLNCHDDVMKPQTKQFLTEEVYRQQPTDTPGDFNQAVMELGALICVPSSPACAQCPLQAQCQAYAAGTVAQLPVKAPKKAPVTEEFTVLVIQREGTFLLHQRPTKGLLAGLWEPMLFSGVLNTEQLQRQATRYFGTAFLQLQPLPASRHIFTHRVWNMSGWLCTLPPEAPLPKGKGYVFATPAQIQEQYALPGAFKAFIPYME